MAQKKKRRGVRTVSEPSDTEETLTQDDATDDDADEAEAEVEDTSDDSEQDSDTGDSESEVEELERLEVNIKLATPKQFPTKLSSNLAEETNLFFKIGDTLVAAVDCQADANALVRILPTSHAADLAQFLYEELEGEGQDPQTIKDISKNGYDYIVSVDW